MRRWMAISTVVILSLSGCAPQAAPTPTPRPTATRIALASPVPTPTTVRVQPPPSPTLVPSPSAEPTLAPIPCAEAICLTAQPVPIAADGTVTLEWNAPGAVKVDVSWQNKQLESIVHADLSPAGSLSFSIADTHIDSPSRSVRVLLTAYYAADGAESRSKELDIQVQARHTITAFAVSPQAVNPGDTVTLTWEIAGEVQAVIIYSLNERGQLDTSYADLAASDSITFTVPAWRRNAVQFHLYAADADGLWAQATASAEITCPDAWFFPNPPADCPSPAQYTKMAVQHFERGLMIWTEWDDQIRVYYDDSPDVHLRSWNMYHNEWFAGMPESDPALAPPPGYHQPVRGFGKLWREGQEHGTSIRELLGWAIEPEYGIDRAAVQCDTWFYGTCYIGDPQGVVYVQGPESSGWYEWAGPDAIP